MCNRPGGRYALALLAGALSPATGAGVRVILPHLVPEGALERANALASTSLQFASLLGPALAGILVAEVGGLLSPTMRGLEGKTNSVTR